MKFPCHQCGACCRRAWLLPKEMLRTNGLEVDEKGHCKNLVDNKCSIYEARPSICRIGFGVINTMANQKLYFEETAKVCNQFMTEDGISDFITAEEVTANADFAI